MYNSAPSYDPSGVSVLLILLLALLAVVVLGTGIYQNIRSKRKLRDVSKNIDRDKTHDLLSSEQDSTKHESVQNLYYSHSNEPVVCLVCSSSKFVMRGALIVTNPVALGHRIKGNKVIEMVCVRCKHIQNYSDNVVFKN